jgi:hypothetical protein
LVSSQIRELRPGSSRAPASYTDPEEDLVPPTPRALPARLLLSLATAAVLTLTACGGGDDEPAAATVPPTQQSATQPATQPAQDSGGGSAQGGGSAEGSSTQLADGGHVAYLKTIDVGGRAISVDVVQYFEGKAAEQAMREDGLDQAAIDTSDFHVRNVNPRLRTLAVASDARISSGLYKGGPKTVELSQLEAQRPDPAAAAWLFRLTLAGGKVTRMDEIFDS